MFTAHNAGVWNTVVTLSLVFELLRAFKKGSLPLELQVSLQSISECCEPFISKLVSSMEC